MTGTNVKKLHITVKGSAAKARLECKRYSLHPDHSVVTSHPLINPPRRNALTSSDISNIGVIPKKKNPPLCCGGFCSQSWT